ncbi:MAG TPA: hypothetical protein VFK31_05095 [Rhodanobacteraceae bacterium]|nr:hypothetical protein [Rhodanobacteraceae bacterium]
MSDYHGGMPRSPHQENALGVSPALGERLAAARIFLITALVAMLVAGFTAAATAHAPTRLLMWMVAYLVLVAGVAQGVLGLGQALLPARLPSSRWRAVEWGLFNFGNVGVIAGTLWASAAWVVVGTVLFVASLAAFLFGVRGAGRGWLLLAFRVVLVVTCIGACVGLALSIKPL